MLKEKRCFEVVIGTELENGVKLMVLEDGSGLGTDGAVYHPVTADIPGTDRIEVVGWEKTEN